MRPDTQAYSGGFSNPVFQSQSTFKCLMDAFARPGTRHRLAALSAPPAPLGPAAGAVALTLCDHDTPVYLSPALLEAGVQSWLAFQTGALVTDDRQEAAFAFYEQGAALPALSTFSAGSQEFPDRSTTIVLGLESLVGGAPLVLSGPGLDGEGIITPRGLPAQFENLWRDNRNLFPRGIDLILTCGNEILCLPRTVSIKHKGQ